MDVQLTGKDLLNFRSLDAARLVSAKFMSRAEGCSTPDYFRRRWPRSASVSTIEKAYTKATVPAAATNSWLSQLAGDFPSDLLTALAASDEPAAIYPRLGLNPVPFQTKLSIDTTDTDSQSFWRKGPGTNKVLVQGNFDTTTLMPRSAASIIVTTKELLRLAKPGTETYLRNLLARHLTRFVDRALLDPSIAAVGDASPASLTNTGTSVTATGEPREDILSLIRQYVSEGGRIESARIAMSSANAVAFAAYDSDEFRTLDARGGTIFGIPTVAGAGAGDVVAILDASLTVVADDGEGNIDTNEEGALEMVDTSVSPHSSQLVSLWQSDSAAILYERVLNWQAFGPVCYVERNYLTTGSPS